MITVTATRSGETTPVLDFDTRAEAEAWLDMLSGLYWAEQAMSARREAGRLVVTALGTGTPISTYQLQEPHDSTDDTHPDQP